MDNILLILLSHQPRRDLERTISSWLKVVRAQSLLLAYGGPDSQFSHIDFGQKAFIADQRLRLPDQQRNRQSWAGVLQAAQAFLKTRPEFDYVYITEYDQIPLVKDVLGRMVARIDAENADVLAHHLQRIDGTSHPHYLYHSGENRFHQHFESISQRMDKRVILSMLGTGSFWTRRAFEAVATREEPFPIYIEIYLPSLAHHLGFRIRDIPDQNPFVVNLGNRGEEIDSARDRGAWTLHPVKAPPLSFYAS